MDKHPLVKAILNDIPLRAARFQEMRAYDQGMHRAAEVVEKVVGEKHFGWVIRRAYDDLGEKKYQYLSQIFWNKDSEITQFGWANSQHNSELFSTDFKDAVLKKLEGSLSEIEAVELFAGNKGE